MPDSGVWLVGSGEIKVLREKNKGRVWSRKARECTKPLPHFFLSRQFSHCSQLTKCLEQAKVNSHFRLFTSYCMTMISLFWHSRYGISRHAQSVWRMCVINLNCLYITWLPFWSIYKARRLHHSCGMIWWEIGLWNTWKVHGCMYMPWVVV